MHPLPIVKMTLYKHGVGFYQRRGGEEGQLRARYVRTLNQLEDQLAQTKKSDDELKQAIEKTKAEIDAALAAF